MIKLDIPVFCNGCDEIKPYAEKEEILYTSIDGTRLKKTNICIKCKHEERCRSICEYIDNIRGKNSLYNEVKNGGGELI